MDIKYDIIITNRAEIELTEIYDYISKSLMAENAASSFMKMFEDSVLRLEKMPEAYAIIENYNKKYVYRKLPIKNYVVIYRIDKEKKIVYIARIVYGGRNYLNEI